MPRFLIEREIPGAGQLTAPELAAISRQSCEVLRQLGPEVQWVQSYVTDDRITCVYIAPSEVLVREHARRGGFPADRVMEIRAIIDPTTAESSPAPELVGTAH
jgi:cell division inhibitor SulA